MKRSMRVNGIVVSGSVFVIAMLLFPANICGAFDSGNVPTQNGDKFWAFSWATLGPRADANVPGYMTGLPLTALAYKDNTVQNDGYDAYLDEISVPWIAIKMSGDQTVRYPFSDIHQYPNIVYNGIKLVTEDNTANGGTTHFTVVQASYDLDFDNDGNVEYQFTIDYNLYQRYDDSSKGMIDCFIDVVSAPHDGPNNVPYSHNMPFGEGQKTCDYIEFAVRCDWNVYGSRNNRLQKWDAVNQWQTINNENNYYDGNLGHIGQRAIKARNDAAARQISVKCYDGVGGDGARDKWFYCLRSYDTQYSQFPSAYQNNENINNVHNTLWTIFRYSSGVDGQGNHWNFPDANHRPKLELITFEA